MYPKEVDEFSIGNDNENEKNKHCLVIQQYDRYLREMNTMKINTRTLVVEDRNNAIAGARKSTSTSTSKWFVSSISDEDFNGFYNSSIIGVDKYQDAIDSTKGNEDLVQPLMMDGTGYGEEHSRILVHTHCITNYAIIIYSPLPEMVSVKVQVRSIQPNVKWENLN